MRTLFKHQIEGIQFLKEKKCAILADSMGMGKTLQAIMAAGESSDGSILVICPASLKINWEREIHAAYPEDTVLILDGKFQGFNNLASWYIVNYDVLQKFEWLQTSVEHGEIETVILDEAHYIKGKKTIRSEKALAITAQAKQVYCLTGTPIMNRPIELFNILKAIRHPITTPEGWPRARTKTPSGARREYGIRYCGAYLKTINRRFGKTIRFWDESGASKLPELREKIRDAFMRRTKEETLDLPEKIITVQPVEFDAEWRKQYDSAWDTYLDWVANHPDEGKDLENIMSAQQLVELGKLKQVCSVAKIWQIIEDIENAIEQGEKVIVFSQYTKTIERIAEDLGKKKIGYVTLTGSDKTIDRQKSVDEFQNDPEVKVFVANIKAGGVGINLTAASIVMFADMDWSPSTHDQAEDRAHRIGTKGTVNVYYYVVKDTIEEDIVSLLDEKRSIIKDVMEGESAATRSITAEFLRKVSQRKI